MLLVGVSSLSPTKTQLVGLRKFAPDLSESLGVETFGGTAEGASLSSACFVVDLLNAVEAVLRDNVAETSRVGTFEPKPSFVAFNLACRSCKSRKPLVLTAALGFTGGAGRAGEPM